LSKRLLVTGGAGFIGANFVIRAIELHGYHVLNLDALTYAGHLASLRAVEKDRRYSFVRGSIGDRQLVGRLLREFSPNWIVNFAAESHVDRSIVNPEAFIDTNIVGTLRLLQETKDWLASDASSERRQFRFLHVSTDEVYGSLASGGVPFSETTRYSPNSPYAASKAGSDHLVRSYHRTYELPALITNCSNNYGPFQYPEKLIPYCLMQAIRAQPLPLYGDGKQIRDWLFVHDHCDALFTVLQSGVIGETYNVGGGVEMRNVDLVGALCELLTVIKPLPGGRHYRDLIVHVPDRAGHDRRYAVDSSRLRQELGWKPQHSFTSGLRKTVDWYLSNGDWLDAVTGTGFEAWVSNNYGNRQ
jgi:dTDP-glucose 4,6-dehydratase